MTNVLFDNGVHKCIMFSMDDEIEENSFLSVNQYLLINNDSAIVIDPGSAAIFHELCAEIEKFIDLNNVKLVFFSHQDPDVAGSISEWSISTNAKLAVPSIWTRFMTHYGILDMDRVFAIPDKGTRVPFGKEYIKLIPAHFLHSPGNFSLYDSASKIVFSGDIGAAIVPPIDSKKEIENFDDYLDFLETFHKRYMANNKTCNAWVKNILELEVSMIAPQHGAIFKDENANKFLDWFSNLLCGTDLIEDLY